MGRTLLEGWVRELHRFRGAEGQQEEEVHVRARPSGRGPVHQLSLRLPVHRERAGGRLHHRAHHLRARHRHQIHHALLRLRAHPALRLRRGVSRGAHVRDLRRKRRPDRPGQGPALARQGHGPFHLKLRGGGAGRDAHRPQPRQEVRPRRCWRPRVHWPSLWGWRRHQAVQVEGRGADSAQVGPGRGLCVQAGQHVRRARDRRHVPLR
mmetsp:Transcript_6310/g.12484  ORF Transcript_6310/g.12484 Transcript_6310/m.12484 type:complete len:208 (+) Transcript_6310:1669-2292(+)